MITPTLWLLMVYPAFLPCSWLSLYVTALLVSGWDETEVGPYVVPQNAKLVIHLLFFSL